MKNTQEMVVERILKKYPDIEFIDEYKGTVDSERKPIKYKFKCLKCRNIFEIGLSSLFTKKIPCPKCSLKLKSLNKIEKYANIFYEKVKLIENIELLGKYTGSDNKIRYKCKKCGNINESIPANILKGCCIHCGRQKTRSNRACSFEDFINRLSIVNPDIEYISGYINLSNKVTVKCKKCGKIWDTRADHLLEGHGCRKCNRNKTQEETKNSDFKLFITKASNKFNNKFDYSKVNYVNYKTPITIICPIHGEFQQTPDLHLRSSFGCPKCSNHNNHITTEEFVEKARELHGDKYDYSKAIYKNNRTKLTIICPKHGEFEITPNAHLSRLQGCPKCSKSKGEILVKLFLDEHNIEYIDQYPIPIDKEINSSGYAVVDFYVKKYNTIIEYNGIQHYKPIKQFGGDILFQKLQKRDDLVKNYCLNNNIKLLIIEEYSSHIHKDLIFEKLANWYISSLENNDNGININTEAVKMI